LEELRIVVLVETLGIPDTNTLNSSILGIHNHLGDSGPIERSTWPITHDASTILGSSHKLPLAVKEILKVLEVTPIQLNDALIGP
jgi:hypothetical protein